MRLFNVRKFTSDQGPVTSGVHSLVEARLTEPKIFIHALPDGFLVFDFSGASNLQGGAIDEKNLRKDLYFSPQAKSRAKIVAARVRVMNAFLACLYEAGQPSFAFESQFSMNPQNYMTAEQVGDIWQLEGPSIREGDRDCKIEVVENAVELFNLIGGAYGAEAVNLLALLQLSSYHYGTHSFSASLTVGWAVVEYLQNVLWKDYCKAAETRTAFNKDRRKLLIEGKDYTASIVSQILSLTGVIDDPLLVSLDKARKKRNDFAHSLDVVEESDASAALRVAAQLISTRIGRQFRLGLSLRWRR